MPDQKKRAATAEASGGTHARLLWRCRDNPRVGNIPRRIAAANTETARIAAKRAAEQSPRGADVFANRHPANRVARESAAHNPTRIYSAVVAPRTAGPDSCRKVCAGGGHFEYWSTQMTRRGRKTAAPAPPGDKAAPPGRPQCG
jgi:hypothetical protein